jgi:DNA anti-recombination protein RmuC
MNKKIKERIIITKNHIKNEIHSLKNLGGALYSNPQLFKRLHAPFESTLDRMSEDIDELVSLRMRDLDRNGDKSEGK